MPVSTAVVLASLDQARVEILTEAKERSGHQSSSPTRHDIAELVVMVTSLYEDDAARGDPGALAAVFQVVGHRPPVYAVRFLDEPLTETNFAAYLSQVEALYATEEPFILVMDLARLHWPPLAFFRKQVAFLREHNEDMRRCVLWSALVVSSAEMRTVLQLLFTIVPPQRPFHVLDAIELQAGDLSTT